MSAFHRVPCRPLINEMADETTKQDDAANNDEEMESKQPTRERERERGAPVSGQIDGVLGFTLIVRCIYGLG